jgi:hypothetical protein
MKVVKNGDKKIRSKWLEIKKKGIIQTLLWFYIYIK